MPPCS